MDRNIKESQLEQVAKQIKEYTMPKAPPLFELFAAVVAITLSIILMMVRDVFTPYSDFYVLMEAVMPQIWWAMCFLAGGTLSAVGMIIDKAGIRVVALLFLVVIYGIVAGFYLYTFPNLAGVFMFWIAVFSAASVPMVKHTSLKHH